MGVIDEPTQVREGEQLPIESLRDWFDGNCPELSGDLSVRQFPSGYSNLTYLIEVDGRDYVLRRPPHGEDIATGHDMKREWTILDALDGVYDKTPRPIAYCDDRDVIGAPFYVMDRVEGTILRENDPNIPGLDRDTMSGLAEAFVRQLVAIHELDYKAAGLGDFGRPDGYIERQVDGWIRRYYDSQTDDISSMDGVGEWMKTNRPEAGDGALIHNDYKYDNLVLNPNDYTDVRAILDWEMATIGDPLMDLGTSLAYWIEPDDSEILLQLDFGPTVKPGNFTRKQLVDRYLELSGRRGEDILFYYVYGLYKVAVIAQQIYYRYEQGHTDDPRFGMAIYAVKALAATAEQSIATGEIGPK